MRKLLIILYIFLLSSATYCSPIFEVLPLGVYGGLKDGNLSAYLLKTIKSKNYASLDAGSLAQGLRIATSQQSIHNKNIASKSGINCGDKIY